MAKPRRLLCATAVSTALAFLFATVIAGVAHQTAATNDGGLHSGASNGSITQVFILFSNHLDVGYTMNKNGSSAGAVVNEYFHKHFPKAIETATEMRSTGKPAYRWMTHSWLLDLFFNCETTKINILGPHHTTNIVCPNASQLAAVEAAVRRGDITYHAFPFNAEPEMYNQAMFDAALNMTFRLDDRFGHKHRQTLSQRDVPGLTRAAVPLLERRGVRAVSIGENSQCAPVAVPPIFTWRDSASGTQVLALFHALGYGRRRREEDAFDPPQCDCRVHDEQGCTCADDPSTLYYTDTNGDTVMKAAADPYDDGPGMHVNSDGTVHASRWEHCVDVDAAQVAICYAWRVDNSGPHTAQEAELLFKTVTEFYPGAKVQASDAFDDFVDAVIPHMDSLPVVTAELGDTWIMGADADPLKVALFRSASRAYAACMNRGGDAACVGPTPAAVAALRTFERLLLTAGEHTWGWNGGDTRRKSWTNAELTSSLKDHSATNDFHTSIGTWQEQRAFISNAVTALPATSPLAMAITQDHDEITSYGTAPFDDAGFTDAAPSSVTCNDLTLFFSTDGALQKITSVADTVASPISGTYFKVWYHNLDHEYITAYARDYIAGPSLLDPEIIAENLVKPNYRLPSLSANATLVRVRAHVDGLVLLDMSFPAKPHEDRGAPSRVQALLSCTDIGEIKYTLRWFNKTRTHAPETVWVSNYPVGDLAMRMDKMGVPIDPLDADLKCDGVRHTCGVHLHGVGDGGIEIVDKAKSNSTFTSRLGLVSIDSALVSIGSADPLPTPLRRPSITGGIHFALVGNTWNTNYPVWYPFIDEGDTSSQFRFTLTTHCANHACP